MGDQRDDLPAKGADRVGIATGTRSCEVREPREELALLDVIEEVCLGDRLVALHQRREQSDLLPPRVAVDEAPEQLDPVGESTRGGGLGGIVDRRLDAGALLEDRRVHEP